MADMICTSLGLSLCAWLCASLAAAAAPVRSGCGFTTISVQQPVDHFNAMVPGTFLQRVLVSDRHWSRRSDAPVLFYTGNEGDIEWFAEQSGFVCDVAAPALGALVVFAEHRYFGKTLPFANESFTGENVGYLSVSQALADFAVVISTLKKQYYSQSPHVPAVIAVGGSYGGMLAAWMRLKYPHLVCGALSASAPVLQFQGFASTTAFNEILEATFRMEGGQECNDAIQDSIAAVTRLRASANGIESLNRIFKPCTAMKEDRDVDQLMSWIVNAITYLPMMDYPYPTSFLEPLPAWPVKAFCKKLLHQDGDGDFKLLQRMAGAMSVYYNHTGENACAEFSSQATASLGALGWDYLACTELVMPMTIPPGSMLPSASWDFAAYSDDCHARWGVRPRLDWATIQFGGDRLSAASNIVFSNGELDPWRGGGVQKSISDTVVAVAIGKGAHHLDLRAPNICDPASVRQVRRQHLAAMRTWVRQHYGQHSCQVETL